MKVAIIGGGASGLFAAAVISKYAAVTVFERNEKAGKKLYITGKGRCNFTNLCSPDEFLASVVRGGKFLIGAVKAFPPERAVAFFEEHGMRTKVERGNRVFPLSDKASDVTATLLKTALSNGCEIRYNARVKRIYKEKSFVVETETEKFEFDKVILATGGLSYPSTGSTGDGYALAASFGHTIVEHRPALCPLITREDVSSLEGLSLRHVAVTIGKRSEFGEMLFTHNGVSGPIILTLSSLVNREKMPLTLSIDLKPALSEAELDKRILRDFGSTLNKNFGNSLGDLLPRTLIPYIVSRSGIFPDKKVNLITREERKNLVELLKNLTFTVDRCEKIDYAIVTSGGVELKEVSPSTMESKLAEGLYIVGELLDVDAFTGGFNLHIAWATAYAAARHLEKSV